MDCLDDITCPPKYDDEYLSCTWQLKTYILESNKEIPSHLNTDKISCKVISTGLEHMKILQVSLENGDSHEFFLDVSDDRFFVLHTRDKSENADRIIESLVKSPKYAFDHVWFYSDLLKRFADKPGNSFKGFGVSYSNKLFKPKQNEDSDIEDLTLNISGSLVEKMTHLVENEPRIKRAAAYNKIRIMRGQGYSTFDFIQDDIYSTGCFVVKCGKSIQDHLHLVDICKKEYSETINKVENIRIGTRAESDKTLVEGQSFDFEFSHKIKDLDVFVEKMFNSATPFKLWGLKSKIHDGYLRISAVDLHTGSPMDFEIADDLMRVYLFKGNCGNTILRLFSNLQMYYDSDTRCEQLR